MKKYYFLLLIIGLLSCNEQQNRNKSGSRPSQVVWVFGNNVELFAEYPVLVMEMESRFAVHLNTLTDFKPLVKGELKVLLTNRDNKYEHTTNISNPTGIFRSVIKPTEDGIYELVFVFSTENFTDTIVAGTVRVYQDAHLSLAGLPKQVVNHDEISFTKEQVWNAEFATKKLLPAEFNEIIKVTGEIQAAPNDEVTISAKSSGLVVFNRSLVPGSPVSAGNELFTLSGAGLAFDNVINQLATAKVKFENSELNFLRASELIKTKAISEKKYLEYKSQYQNDSIVFFNLSRNISEKGVGIKSPITGYIQGVFISEGQYVEAGAALAVVSKNQTMTIRADIPLQHHQSLKQIGSANFRLPHSNKTFSLQELNGKLVSVGKSARGNHFLPAYFEINNNGHFVDGALTEVYIKTKPLQNQIVVPKSAIIEEQGKYFVYVQTGGESYVKRYIDIMAFDGNNYAVKSGIDIGERVVTKGAYYIRLASMAGSLPLHGHTH